MSKNFPIPHLDQESWDGVQASLDSIGRLIRELQDTELNQERKKKLELASIHMGLVDVYLGREYTLEEAFNKVKKDVKYKTVEERAEEMFEYNSHIWAICCDPNLGDYFKEYMTKDTFERYKECVIAVFDSPSDMYRYISKHDMTLG